MVLKKENSFLIEDIGLKTAVEYGESFLQNLGEDFLCLYSRAMSCEQFYLRIQGDGFSGYCSNLCIRFVLVFGVGVEQVRAADVGDGVRAATSGKCVQYAVMRAGGEDDIALRMMNK